MHDVKRALPLILLIVTAVVLWMSGVAGTFSWARLGLEQARLAGWVADHPIIAPVLFVLIYIASTVLSLPQAAFLTIVGGLLFGSVLGAVLAVTGATSGAVVLFVITRSAFGGVIARRGGPLMATLRDALARDGFSYLLTIRLLPIFPFWLVNLAAPLSGIRLTAFALATALGIAPPTFVIASVGAGIGDVLAAGGRPDVSLLLSAPILLPLGGLALLSLGSIAWKRRRHA